MSKFTRDVDVRFNIINLYKSKSLYQQGMRILCLDQTPTELGKPSECMWHRTGTNIYYGENVYCRVKISTLNSCYRMRAERSTIR